VRSERVAQFGGFALEVGQLALTLLGFIGLCSDVMIVEAVLEHVVHRAGNLVGRSDNRLLGTELGALATVEGAKGRVAADDGSRGLAKSLPGAAIGLEGAGAQDLAAGDVVVGGQPQPGGKVLLSRPAGHVSADLRKDGLGEGGADAVHGDQACLRLPVQTGGRASRSTPVMRKSLARVVSAGEFLLLEPGLTGGRSGNSSGASQRGLMAAN